MNRRNLIKRLGLGLSAGLVAPAWLSACKSDDPEPELGYTVAVIGGGAAGLFAADILNAQGIRVVVLEASNRLGGRVRSLKTSDRATESLYFNALSPLSSDYPNELGAEQVLGSDSRWAKVIADLNLATSTLTGHTTDNYFLDDKFTDQATALTDSDFLAAKSFYNFIGAYTGPNVSVQDAINAAGLNPRVHGILNAWIGNKYGTSNDRLSMTALAEGANLRTRNNDILTLTDNPMQDALFSRFTKVATEAKVNMVVKTIDYTGAKVVVSGDNASTAEPFSMEVDKVIVTVPVSVLKSGDITFTPALPGEKTSALANMDMDATVRVLLDFKVNFWGTSSAFLYGGNAAPEYFNSGALRSEITKTLTVTVGGSKGAALSALGKNAIPTLLSELDSIFDGKATINARRDTDPPNNIIAVIQDWSREPFIRGGSSFLKPTGTNEDRVRLSKAVNEKIFFAGEATDTNGEFGTINGALLSGERAAIEVIAAL